VVARYLVGFENGIARLCSVRDVSIWGAESTICTSLLRSVVQQPAEMSTSQSSDSDAQLTGWFEGYWGIYGVSWHSAGFDSGIARLCMRDASLSRVVIEH